MYRYGIWYTADMLDSYIYTQIAGLYLGRVMQYGSSIDSEEIRMSIKNAMAMFFDKAYKHQLHVEAQMNYHIIHMEKTCFM